jgi:hypothetical protein
VIVVAAEAGIVPITRVRASTNASALKNFFIFLPPVKIECFALSTFDRVRINDHSVPPALRQVFLFLDSPFSVREEAALAGTKSVKVLPPTFTAYSKKSAVIPA